MPDSRAEATPAPVLPRDGVVGSMLATERGEFAVLSSQPRGAALPRGSVLLVPGFTGSKEDFAALLPLLSDSGWSAASYDQRGQFESPVNGNEDFSLPGFGRDTLAVSAALFGTAERVHLVGHSFGGLVGAAAATASPNTWASLTLLCSGPGGVGGSARTDLLEGIALVESAGLEAAYQQKLLRERANGQPPPPPEVERWLHARFLANSAVSLTAIARHVADAPDMTQELVALELPVFVVRGEYDDGWPHDVQQRLAEALDTRVVIVEGAGHSPAREAPEATRDALVRLWLS